MAQFIRGRAFFNHTTKGGFSESYKFNTTDYLDAKVRFRNLLNYRALLLGENMRIEWASLSLSNADRDSEVPTNYLTVGQELDTEDMAGVEPVNTISTGVKIRLFTGTGAASTVIFRGIRDSWAEDQVLTVTPAAAVSYGLLPPAAAGLTAAEAIMAFAVVLRHQTCHAKKTAPGVYTLTPWSTYVIQGIGERDCGPGWSPTRGRKRATI